MPADRHILDPLQYYGFARSMVSATKADASLLHDAQWRLRFLELDNRELANCLLPVRVVRRIFTRATHRVKNRHWMSEMIAFPSIRRGLPNAIRLTVGQNDDWMVQVGGSPDVRVEWLKGSVPLVEDEHVYIRHYRPCEYMLTIRDVRPSDRGMYTCIVSNIAGSVRTMGELYVSPIDPDSIVVPEEEVEVEEVKVEPKEVDKEVDID